MRIAAVQLRITDDEPPAARLARVLDLIGGLAGRADMVVLPELWLTGAFATRAAIEHAEPMDGPTWTALARAAAGAGVYLLAGSLSETGDPADAAAPSVPGAQAVAEGAAAPAAPTVPAVPTVSTVPGVPAVPELPAELGHPASTGHPGHTGSTGSIGHTKPYNTAVLFGPDGSRLAVYRKVHLFGFDGGEADAFAAGPIEPVVWDSPWGRFGLATCYDLRFPELFRALVDGGAEGFLIPTGWPARRIERWDVLARARAIENQAWTIGVNAVGTHAGVAMGGRSMVVDPMGDVVYRGSDDAEEVPVVAVDMNAAAAWRERFPALRDRRIPTPRQ